MTIKADIRNDFPVLRNHPELIFFDSAATSLKPDVVINAITHYYTHIGANIHRGIYDLSEEGTEAYEQTRKVVADFLNSDADEVIFTKSTTESINLLAYSLGEDLVRKGVEVVV